MKKPLPPFPRLSGRLYVFPALLPLAEIIPWALAAIGSAAGVAGIFSRYKKIFLIAGIAIVASGAGIAIYFDKPFTNQEPAGGFVVPTQRPVTHAATPAPLPLPPVMADKFSKSWHVALPRKALSTPVADDAYIYFGTHDGHVMAFERANGDLVWETKKADKYVYGLSLSDDHIIYAGEGLHEDNEVTMTAIERAVGRVLWSRKFTGHLEEGAAIELFTNRIYFSAGPGGMWALDRRNGEVIWHAPIGHSDMTPVIFDDDIAVQAQPDEKQDSSIFAVLDKNTGVEKWRVPLNGQPWGAPYYDAQTQMLYTASGRGQIGRTRKDDAGWLYAISPVEQKIMWQKELPTMAIGPEVYLPEQGMVVVTLKDGRVAGYSLKDGARLWQTQVGIEMQSASALVRGGARPLVAMTSYEGIFSILDAITGSTVFTNALDEHGTSAPVAQGSSVYVLTQKSLIAFDGLTALAPE